MPSLDSPGVSSLVARKVLSDINDYAVRTYHEPHRWHLGASLIGAECSRYLWYVFRWCGFESGNEGKEETKAENFGRMLRLWNRGHREEARYKEYLEGIGFKVWMHDENGDQLRMSAVNGHFGGSLDGIAKFPERYGIDEPVLLEFKTNGTGKGFTELFEKKVAVAKPQHYTQMSQYGYHYKLRYCLYLNTNKNDDDMYTEVIELNWNQAEMFQAKAERIIISDEPPPKLAENPTYFKCTYCSMKAVCHHKAAPPMNCRSCKFARPTLNSEWHCQQWNNVIPRDVVPIGCDKYIAIVNAA